MPVFNVTIPDSSPLIGYSGSWSDTPKTNADWQQYQNQTYHVTSQDGATATLRFNGSAIYIFGARKSTYSGYSIALDGGPETDASAMASGSQYNSLLYNAASLDTTKEHQVVLKNAPGSSVDIDYMIITAGDGNNQTVPQDTFYNQDDNHILYSANWVGATNVAYSNQNAQITYAQGASATVTFEGNAISLFGTVNNDHGMFSVSIDGGVQSNFNGIAPEPRFQTLLYYASGLSSGKHTLKLTNVSPANSDPNVKTNGLELDTVSVSSWPDPPPSQPNSTPTPSSGSSSATGAVTNGTAGAYASVPPAHRVSTGVVVGSAIAAVAGVILFALGLYLHCRRRSRHRREIHERQNVLWQEGCAPTDPFRTPTGSSVMVHYVPSSALTSTNASSAYVSTAPSSTTPSHTFEQQSMYYATPETSAVVMTQAATYGTSGSEKRRLVALDAAASASVPLPQAQSSYSAAGLSYANDDNPHEDFPPPNYGQVFPSSHV